MQPRSTLTRKPSGVLRASIYACRAWLQNEWNSRFESPKLRAVLSAAQQDEDQIVADSNIPRNQVGQPLTPYATLNLVNMQERQGQFNNWAAQYVGQGIGYTRGRQEKIVEHVKPVEIGIGVRFRTLSLEEALAFAALWVENAPSCVIEVANKATNATFRINIGLDPNVSLPTAAGSGGPDDVMDVETTMICRTFSGFTEMHTVIKSINIGFLPDGLDGNPDDAVELLSIKRNYVDLTRKV